MITKQKKQDTRINDTIGLTASIVGMLIFIAPYFGLPLSIIGLWLGTKGNGGLGTASKTIGIIGIVINSITLIMLAIGVMMFL